MRSESFKFTFPIPTILNIQYSAIHNFLRSAARAGTGTLQLSLPQSCCYLWQFSQCLQFHLPVFVGTVCLATTGWSGKGSREKSFGTDQTLEIAVELSLAQKQLTSITGQLETCTLALEKLDVVPVTSAARLP